MKQNELVHDDVVLSKIYLIRGMKVMLDADLAELYGVETSQLKRSVRRNAIRFPNNFMFELSHTEIENLRCQSGISSWGGARYSPMAFTENGVAMLSSVLNSERAIVVNIQIIRIFTKMRELLSMHKDILLKLEHLEQKVSKHDGDIKVIFEYLKELISPKDDPVRRIGFKTSRERNLKSQFVIPSVGKNKFQFLLLSSLH